MTEDEKYFDIGGETDSRIVNLNRIIGAIQHLKKVMKGDKENLQFAEMIYENAWELKEELQGSLKLLAKDLPEDFEPVDFTKTINEAFLAVRLIEKIEYDFFQIDNEFQGVFFGRDWMIWQLAEFIIEILIKYHTGSGPLQINVTISNWEKRGVVISFSNPDTEFPEHLVKSLKSNRKKFSHDELNLILKLTDCLMGQITLRTAQTLVVFLPNYSPE